MRGIIPNIPLVDLHCHIEGAAPPAFVRECARRNKIALPDDMFTPDGAYLWTDFRHFLKAYDAVCEVIRTPEDYCDLAYGHFADAAGLGMIYGEVFISADHAANTGISYPDMVAALAEGLGRACDETGVQGRFILTAIRHYGVDKCVAVARLAHDHPHPLVTGFGMSGDENWGAPSDFARTYDIARDASLGLTVHAGEVCGPSSVKGALDALKPSRIGHGVRSIEDESVVARLAAEGVTLEICPGSNIALGVYDDYAQSPVIRLRDAGVRVTINSDDPPYFHTDIANEYAQVQKTFGLSEQDMRAISQTAIEAAFCDAGTKANLLEKLNP